MRNLKANIFGGVTAAVVALPLALAFGDTSGAGAAAGLYGAIVLGFCAALFGGTPTQISGPTGPMTVVVAAGLVTFHGNLQALMATIFLAGILQIIFGVAGFGKWVRYIPYPVVSGFMCGIGVIIIILQINPLVGGETQSSINDALWYFPQALLATNPQAILIAGLTLAILFFLPAKISRIIPAPLIALLGLTTLSVGLHFSVPTIGSIPSTLPIPSFPAFPFANLHKIGGLAFTLAILGCMDSLLTSLVADSITKTKHNSNRELIGQGIGNTLCSLIGGIPGAGATMRTVVNIKSGGKTKLSGMVHALTLLTTVLFLAPLAAQIPKALLAGILIKVGLDILDYKFIRILKQVPRNDLLVMLAVFLVTVFVDLITAVGLGFVLAALLSAQRIAQEANIKLVSPETGEATTATTTLDRGLHVVKIEGAFFFGSSLVLEERVDEILDTRMVIVDCSTVPFMDLSAIFVLEEMILKLRGHKIKVALVLRERHQRKIAKVDTAKVFDGVAIYDSLDKAVAKSQPEAAAKAANTLTSPNENDSGEVIVSGCAD